jgi:hypothetical protein
MRAAPSRSFDSRRLHSRFQRVTHRGCKEHCKELRKTPGAAPAGRCDLLPLLPCCPNDPISGVNSEAPYCQRPAPCTARRSGA